jgi:hypothetical protein
MSFRDRTAVTAIAALLAAGGLLGAAHVSALDAGGPDRTAEIIQLSQDEFDAMSTDKLNDLHDDLGRHNTAAGSLDVETAAAFVRINNALISQPGRRKPTR